MAGLTRENGLLGFGPEAEALASADSLPSTRAKRSTGLAFVARVVGVVFIPLATTSGYFGGAAVSRLTGLRLLCLVKKLLWIFAVLMRRTGTTIPSRIGILVRHVTDPVDSLGYWCFV